MHAPEATPPGYDRLTEHEKDNFTPEGFVLFRAESLENLVGDMYSDVCDFPGQKSLQGNPDFHPKRFEERVEEMLYRGDEEIDLAGATRDHWQPTSYGTNPDEIKMFAEFATEDPMFETTENPTPILTKSVVPQSEVDFDLPEDDSSVTSKPISRFYADSEKEYQAHYQTPAEWISSITLLDNISQDSDMEPVVELENRSHDPELTRETYTPISWELHPDSLDKYPRHVQQEFNQDEPTR